MSINLQSISGRAELAPRGRPYVARLVPGVHLGYRANTSSGVWVAIGSDGKQGQWHERIGVAEDNEHKADGVTVLTYAQAADQARHIANGRKGADTTKPKTIGEALDAYALDLTNRGKNPYNAQAPRVHLTPALLAQPVDKVSKVALRTWRQSLLDGGMKPATLNRTMKVLAAALNLAALEDSRAGANREAWRVGLKKIAGDRTARDAVLSDAQVRAIVAAAYDIDPAFGLFVQVHAETGSRSSQIERITVGDLRSNLVLVPTSRKGSGNDRATNTPVPITPALAAALAAAVAGRASNEPLLLKSDGTPWEDRAHRGPFERAAKAAGVPDATIYALRHSSIARALHKNVPIAFVAKIHDTSVAIIEAHYGAHICRVYDDLMRAALIDTTPGSNVINASFPQPA